MEDLEDRIERFSNLLSHYTREERDTILSAARWGANLHRNQKRASGEPYFIHPMAVAEILIHLRLDYQAIIAALLHDVLEDTEVRHEELRQRFGREVESLVNGVTKISVFRAAGKVMQGAETIRKMLFAMVKDIRVILIKLADKLHNMQTLEYLDRSRGRKIAAECLDIYAPLAGRLGISWVKDELEDLALKCLHPDAYLQINRYISERRDVRASHLDSVKMEISREAALEGVDVDIKTRAKRFYSIYQKMKNQAKGMDEIYDLLGIRILCDTTVECYTLLGLVHRLWKPLAGRFKDYIAMPKANRYRDRTSLLLSISCVHGTTEFFLRLTFSMKLKTSC
jgi:GTP pyrophosphokinase